jgi:hypothetical protein
VRIELPEQLGSRLLIDGALYGDAPGGTLPAGAGLGP